MAGMLGLDPASMELVAGGAGTQMARALLSCEAVAEVSNPFRTFPASRKSRRGAVVRVRQLLFGRAYRGSSDESQMLSPFCSYWVLFCFETSCVFSSSQTLLYSCARSTSLLTLSCEFLCFVVTAQLRRAKRSIVRFGPSTSVVQRLRAFDHLHVGADSLC